MAKYAVAAAQRRKDFHGKAQGEDNIAEHKGSSGTRYVRCHKAGSYRL